MEGTCLCGAITIRARTNEHVEACHCGMCRKRGGGSLLAVHCGTETTIDGLDQVQTFASSDWAERGFCKTCGMHPFYKLKQTNDYIVPAGLFQDGVAFELKGQIFIDRKPSYYEFANQTSMRTEEEVYQQYVST